MTPDRWRRIEAVCHEALALPPTRREAFLDEACAGDAELRQQVESLLAQESGMAAFLEEPMPGREIVGAVGARNNDEHRAGWGLPHGTRLGPYELTALIGTGGMGQVYQAHDSRLGRTVAVKVLPPSLADDPERHARFEREARAVAALNHPHICTLHDIGEVEVTSTDAGRADLHVRRTERVTYLVMEHLAGATLAQRLRKGPLPVRHALEIGTQIAEALDAAHKHGIVHRDLKPANVMLTDSGAKLLDFGLAKLRASEAREATETLPPTSTEPLTQAGEVLGTRPYMAPEQVEGKATDARTDLWALGCVLYEMVAGRPAFPGDSAASITAAILAKEPEPLTTRQPLTPPGLERLVARCLAKRPDQRWGSACDVADELRWIAQTEGGSAASRRIGAGVRVMSRRGVMGLVAFVALAAALGAAWWSGWPARSTSGSRSGSVTSIAVLPLENLAGDAGQDYFADGLTEALISELSQIRSLRVISRTSVMRYKGTRKPIPEIARELNGVAAIVEGSVTREADRVGVTVQLIDSRLDSPLWSQSYERSVRDVLTLRREIARRVAQGIRAAITPDEERQLATRETVDPEALEQYLRALDLRSRSEAPDDLRAAADLLRTAVTIDTRFAEAFAALAEVNALLWWERFDHSPDRRSEAHAAADRALELNPDLPDAHRAKGIVCYFDLDYASALGELAAALELNPSDARSLANVGFIRRRQGRVEEARLALTRAVELSPLDAFLATNLAETYLLLRQADAAERAYQSVLELEPTYARAFADRIRWRLRLAPDVGGARDVEGQASATGVDTDPWVFYHRVMLHLFAGDHSQALELLSRRPVDNFDFQMWFVPGPLLEAHAHDRLGRRVQALERYAKARHIAEARLADESDDSRAYSALGLALAGLGDKAGAVRAGETAIDLMPVQKDAWRGACRLEDLARIYVAVGEREQAVAILTRLLSMPFDLAGPALVIDPTWAPLRGHPGFERLTGSAPKS